MPPIRTGVNAICLQISELEEKKVDLELELGIIERQLQRYIFSNFPPLPEEKFSAEETTDDNQIYGNDYQNISIELIIKKKILVWEIDQMEKKIARDKFRLSICQTAECKMLAEKRQKALQFHRDKWRREHPNYVNETNDDLNDDEYDTID